MSNSMKKLSFLRIFFIAAVIMSIAVPVFSQDAAKLERMESLYVSTNPEDHPSRNYERDIRRKAQTDSTIFANAEGAYEVEKTTYRSRIGDMDIPVYIFQPLEKRGRNGHAALVWVHGGVHGNLNIEYYRFIPEAVARGYVVVVPEYRGSTGYGKEHHNAIDYGGYEVDDVLTAVDYIKKNLPIVDPERIGIWGQSHGGYITLFNLFREDNPFKCGIAMVPVTNLIFRLSYKGPRYQRNFATQKRIGGLPFEKKEIYKERSPFYHVDKLNVPLLVHAATNDTDVIFEELEPLILALQVKKPGLAETKVYQDPPNGHFFATRGDSRELRDSWMRQWRFLEWNLQPGVDKSKGEK
ncbi:S9 family peptidase [candidate division KSB1 bacterium]|nr:S9 family peptidase [candidate division KSB1 bacterium]